MIHWIVRMGAALLLSFTLAGTAGAAAPDGKTPTTALPLSSSLSAGGTLEGSSVGSFAYYTFDYPGHGVTGALTLTVSPTDSNTTNAVGITLYQPGVTLLSMNALGSLSGRNVGLFYSPNAGPILIQVYNYLPGQAASYIFGITGITPPAPPGTTSAAPGTTPVTAPAENGSASTPATAVALPASLSASGTLIGSTVGSFAYYTLPYSGNGTTGTISLTVSPSDANTTNAVGVNLYQNGVSLLSMNALGAVSGSKIGLFSSPTAAPILIQVYNYLPGQQVVSYNFTVSGVSQ